jgi:hypothetical protein
MTILLLKNKTMMFPAIASPEAIGDGDPAYGARFVIDPTDPDVALIEAALLEVATAKWKNEGAAVLAMLVENGKVAFERKPYRNRKTGKVYEGFEDKFSLGSRNPKTQPTTFDQYGRSVLSSGNIERIFYSGAVVHPKVEFWAQDNSFGRRVNCSLLGLMFAADGPRFGGGAPAASADDFAGFAATEADADDVL